MTPPLRLFGAKQATVLAMLFLVAAGGQGVPRSGRKLSNEQEVLPSGDPVTTDAGRSQEPQLIQPSAPPNPLQDESTAGKSGLEGDSAEPNTLLSSAAKSHSRKAIPKAQVPVPAVECSGTMTEPSFWSHDFGNIVQAFLGASSSKECNGEPNEGGYERNLGLAQQAKNIFYQEAGCTNDFEVACWAGVHGSDHQGAKDSKACNRSIPRYTPGIECQRRGGTDHTFCTGAGKSNFILVNPKGAPTRSIDIGALAISCAGSVGLLTEFTRCMMDSSNSLRGVLALPTEGNKDPNGGAVRLNDWAFTGACPFDGWYHCSNQIIRGRALTIIAAQPLA